MSPQLCPALRREDMEPAGEEYRCFGCVLFFLLLWEAVPSSIKTVFTLSGVGDEELNYHAYSFSCHIPIFLMFISMGAGSLCFAAGQYPATVRDGFSLALARA